MTSPLPVPTAPSLPLAPLLSVLLAILLCGCASSSPPGSAAAETSAEPPTEVVAVVRPSRSNLARMLALTGELKAYQEVDVHARVGGYIRRMYVDVGDELRAGSPIAEIEVPELADDLAGAEATTQQLEAEIGRAERELERATADAKLAETLASRLASVHEKEPGLVARQEIDEARLKRDAADAQVHSAESALNAAKQRAVAAGAVKARSATMLDFRKVTAPFSGVVTDRLADTGAMVRAVTSTTSQPIVRLAQISRLRLVVPVPEGSAATIRAGTPVEVTIAALGKTFHTKVSRSTNTLRRATSTMDIEIDLPNPDHSLLPGMYADATFTVDDRPSVLTVPVQALSRHEGKPTLMVVDASGQVAERDVHTGMTTETQVEITSGLQDQDSVIVGDRSRLRVGQQVQTKVVTVG